MAAAWALPAGVGARAFEEASADRSEGLECAIKSLSPWLWVTGKSVGSMVAEALDEIQLGHLHSVDAFLGGDRPFQKNITSDRGGDPSRAGLHKRLCAQRRAGECPPPRVRCAGK